MRLRAKGDRYFDKGEVVSAEIADGKATIFCLKVQQRVSYQVDELELYFDVGYRVVCNRCDSAFITFRQQNEACQWGGCNGTAKLVGKA